MIKIINLVFYAILLAIVITIGAAKNSSNKQAKILQHENDSLQKANDSLTVVNLYNEQSIESCREYINNN